jgi:thermitase
MPADRAPEKGKPTVKRLIPLLSIFFLLTQPGLATPAQPSRDAFKPRNWGLAETAASAERAWKITQGSPSVVVAVIDTGIDPEHPDLKPNLWKAPGSRATPVYGWDFVNRAPNPTDPHGHGTHIAGIIGALSNPKSGTSGVAPKVQIMPIRYYSEIAPGSINLANTIKALHYAIDNGAKIINYSGGGPEYSEEEFQAMKKAEARGVLIVAAAGNEHNNTDREDRRYYPAAYQSKGLRNIITVASIDSENKILPSSNWGVRSVDVAAPGEGILSTIPGNRYGKMTGTSQATAFVSGVAALILSKAPHLTPSQVKDIIVRSATRLAGLAGKVASGGKINALQALTLIEGGRSTASKN